MAFRRTTYAPRSDSPDTGVADLARSTDDKFRQLSKAISQKTQEKFEERHVAPDKPRDGMIVYADGTNWNPGSGEGLYAYVNGAWKTLVAPTVPALASTTDVLTGTDTAKTATSDAIAALWEKGSNVASASTISLGEGGYFHITGTTTITDIDFATAHDGRAAICVFDGILTLTHNATTLILPTGANITTAAGDVAVFVQDSNDNVKCTAYLRADGKALTASYAIAAQSDQETASATDQIVTPGRQHFHPSASKCWGRVTVSAGVPTLQASYNTTSITDTATGRLTVTIATDFSSANYPVIAMEGRGGSVVSDREIFVNTGTGLAAGSFELMCEDSGGGDTDPVEWYWATFGDQ